MGVPPVNRPAVPRDWLRGVPERYVAVADTRGRQEGRPYPRSQQVIRELSGLRSRQSSHRSAVSLVMSHDSRFSIAFPLPYDIFVKLFVCTPAHCEQEDFLFDESIVSALPTEDRAVLSGMIVYRLIEIS